MISFYPGPSRVHDEIPEYVKEAYKKGILSINHRSEAFMKLSERTITLLKSKLEIPEDYTVLYTTSATECWEIIAQSVIQKSSFHFFNGAFGKKWFEYTQRLRAGAKAFPFSHDELIDVKRLTRPKKEGVICLTQNETSNGTQIHMETMNAIRERYPDYLIAVDATSSMGGVYLNFKSADIWYASVQKCFGLPAGLGIMILSPAAVSKVKQAGENKHYNSLGFMLEMIEKWQTPFTPNVLNIFLLNRVMEASKPVREVHNKTEDRFHRWVNFFDDKQSLKHLVSNEEARSFTVVPVTTDEDLVNTIKSRARKNGILLGEGYGDLKATTFRIANFPAIKKKEINTLMDFLSGYA